LQNAANKEDVERQAKEMEKGASGISRDEVNRVYEQMRAGNKPPKQWKKNLSQNKYQDSSSSSGASHTGQQKCQYCGFQHGPSAQHRVRHATSAGGMDISVQFANLRRNLKPTTGGMGTSPIT
jgi:hypothetical protein